MDDEEFQLVVTWFGLQDDLLGRIGRVVRGGIDDVLNTRYLNRVDIHGRDVGKTEKTHVGTRVEIRFLQEFALGRGATLDAVIDGVEVDVKFTLGTNWMIPREAIDRLCILIRADDRRSEFSAGILRCTRDRLTGPVDDAEVKQGDRKRSVSADGKTYIRQLVPDDSPLPENLLLHLEPTLLDYVLSDASQQRRFIRLFSESPGRVLNRHYVEAIGRSTDPQRRVRNVGSELAEQGLVLLCGTWLDERAQAAIAGIRLEDGDFVAIPPELLDVSAGDPPPERRLLERVEVALRSRSASQSESSIRTRGSPSGRSEAALPPDV